jgi:hypothetical protein
MANHALSGFTAVMLLWASGANGGELYMFYSGSDSKARVGIAGETYGVSTRGIVRMMQPGSYEFSLASLGKVRKGSLVLEANDALRGRRGKSVDIWCLDVTEKDYLLMLPEQCESALAKAERLRGKPFH